MHTHRGFLLPIFRRIKMDAFFDLCFCVFLIALLCIVVSVAICCIFMAIEVVAEVIADAIETLWALWQSRH